MTAWDTARWKKALAELDYLLPLTEPERLARLAALRARNPALAADIAGLLDEHRAARAEHFLEEDAHCVRTPNFQLPTPRKPC